MGLLAAVKVLVLQHVGRARLLLGVAIHVVQCHAVAVRAVHSVPFSRQRLVAGGSQGDVSRNGGRAVVGVGDGRTKCRGVHRDPGELVLFGNSVAVQVGLYALHQHGGHVVVTRGGECAAGGNIHGIRATTFNHAQVVIRPGTVLLRIQIEPHGVGLVLLRIGDVSGGLILRVQIQLHAGQLRAGQELYIKVAVRLDPPLAGGVAVHTQVDEQAFRGAAVLVAHRHLGHVRALKLTVLDFLGIFRNRFLQVELGDIRVVRHLIHAQLLLQFRHIAVRGRDEHTQLAIRRIILRLILNSIFILAVALLCRQQCDAVLGHLIGADLQHGDAHLFAGLRVQTVGHLRRPHRGAHGPHAVAAGPPAPVVLLDLLIQRPGIILPPQLDVAAEVVGDDVIDAVAGQDQRPLLGYAAVDTQVLPCVRGHILQHVLGGTARISPNADRGLRAQDEVHLGVDQLLAAQLPEAEAAQLLGYLHRCAEAAPAVQVHMGVLGLGVVVQPAEYTGLDLGVQLKDRADRIVFAGRDQLQAHAAARPQAGVFRALIPPLLAHQPQVHLKLIDKVHLGDGQIRPGELQIARPDGHVGPALDDLHIVALHRHLHPDGREGDKVAVDGVGQPVESAAAALDERRGHRRYDGDAPGDSQPEVQVVGRKPPVVQPLQVQLRRRLEQVEHVQLQREVVLLLAVKRVDVRLQLRQIQTHQRPGVQLTAGLEALLHEGDAVVLLLLRPIAQPLQLDQLIAAAVQDKIQPHIPGQLQAAVPLDQRLADPAADLRDVDEHQHRVVLRLHVQRQLLAVKGQLRRLCHPVLRGVQQEARRAVRHLGRGVELGHKPVFVHPDAEMLPAAPGGGDGGGQPHLQVRILVILAVVVPSRLEIAAQDVERVAVLLLQHVLPRRVGDGRGHYFTAALIQPQPVGVLGDGHPVRLGELHVRQGGGLLLGVNIPEAPHLDRAQRGMPGPSAYPFCAALGGKQVVLRVIRHIRRGLCIVGAAQRFLVGQHKGTVHAVAVGVDLAHVALAEHPGHIGAAHAGGDVRALGGIRTVLLIAAARLHMGRGVCLGVAHPGKAVVLLKPAEYEIRGRGEVSGNVQSPKCLGHQRVGLAVRRYIRGLKVPLARALIQLHKVVADVARKLRGWHVGKGVFNSQGIL